MRRAAGPRPARADAGPFRVALPFGVRRAGDTDLAWIVLWATAMARACWQGALLILAVGIASRLFPRLPAAARCWLWWLACLKLLVGLAWITPPALPVPTHMGMSWGRQY